MSGFDLKHSRADLDVWFETHKSNKDIYDLIVDIHDRISSFEYRLLDYTIPIFSDDVAKTIEEYTQDEIDWKIADSNIKTISNYQRGDDKELDKIYILSKRELQSLIREKKAGFSYQAETISIWWYTESGIMKTKDYHKVNLFELDLPPIRIYTIRISDLFISNGSVYDLWKFMIRNSYAIKHIYRLTFNHRIHECTLIGYMNHMIRDLLYEMSNHIYASYNFSSYLMQGRETRLDLYKFLCKEEKTTEKFMTDTKSQFTLCLRELVNRG